MDGLVDCLGRLMNGWACGLFGQVDEWMGLWMD